MKIKLPVLLSLCLFSFIEPIQKGDYFVKAQSPPTDCSKCYYLGQAYSIGAVNGANNQSCAMGSNGKGAVWVNHGAAVPPATCMYCELANAWYSEGAVNGTSNPVQYCSGGQWKQ